MPLYRAGPELGRQGRGADCVCVNRIIDCWSTDDSRAGGEQVFQGFWTGRRSLTWPVVFQDVGVKSCVLEDRLHGR